MLVTFTRELPDSRKIQVAVNPENVLWVQPVGEPEDTFCTLKMIEGPELTIRGSFGNIVEQLGGQ